MFPYSLVKRNQTKVLDHAAKSNAIVASLFPAAVRERLMDEAESLRMKDRSSRTSFTAPSRRLKSLGAEAETILSERRTLHPYGLAGGAPGQPGRNLLRRAGHSAWEELPPIATFEVSCGDVLRIETPGGGGYGRSEP